MNAFEDARGIEARGMAVLLPFLKRRAHDGQLVLMSKGRLAAHLQEIVGDVMFNTDAEGRFKTVEVKCEEQDKYGNFFIEVFSNRNLDDRQSHADRGSNPGWMFKQRAELLFYYFVASDELYVIDFFELKRWAFAADERGRMRGGQFKFKKQDKRAQANDTWGWCVPISEVVRAVNCKKLFPRQIEMFPEVAA